MSFFKLKSLFITLALLMGACSPFFHQPMSTRPARLGTMTTSMKELNVLPPPEDKIVAAVYKFRDQTGQYKESDGGVNWSTAVTQGATSILLRALEESNWFIPIEREGLSNLLNERKIIRSSRANYGPQQEQDQSLLPPLLFAGVLLEGGIISFDSNILTGGAGLRYFGAGGSGEYRQDRVTIYLRAISTSNGRILKTVYTSKTILSQKVDAGLFRFVKFKRLLEAETGFTYNEPTELAVREAIEKAVFSLIVEGVQEELWQFAQEDERTSLILDQYQEEKDRNYNLDEFGIFQDQRRKDFALGLNIGGLSYAGDFAEPVIRPAGDISFGYNGLEPLTFDLQLGIGRLAAERSFDQSINYGSVSANYILFPRHGYSPYFSVGTGFITENENDFFDLSNDIYFQGIVGGGFEFFLSADLSAKLHFSHHYLFSDQFDGIEQGKYNDFFWDMKIGITYLFQ
ncbi:MAG: CsgG/HfaB family protein [Candidatus Cyclobacteriaceae bacterium M3_2C_046]